MSPGIRTITIATLAVPAPGGLVAGFAARTRQRVDALVATGSWCVAPPWFLHGFPRGAVACMQHALCFASKTARVPSTPTSMHACTHPRVRARSLRTSVPLTSVSFTSCIRSGARGRVQAAASSAEAVSPAHCLAFSLEQVCHPLPHVQIIR